MLFGGPTKVQGIPECLPSIFCSLAKDFFSRSCESGIYHLTPLRWTPVLGPPPAGAEKSCAQLCLHVPWCHSTTLRRSLMCGNCRDCPSYPVTRATPSWGYRMEWDVSLHSPKTIGLPFSHVPNLLITIQLHILLLQECAVVSCDAQYVE